MNRQQKRQQARKIKVTGQTGRITDVADKPTGQLGVEINRTGDKVFFTLFSYNTAITTEWGVKDAVQIGRMLVEAGEKEEGEVKEMEVVRSSGLVVVES